MHNDFTLSPEKLEVTHIMVSNYCCNIANEYGIKISGADKLVSNSGDKSKYVLHYRYLWLYLSLGMN